MKIYRHCVIDIATWTIESQDAYDYEGPIGLCKKNTNTPPPPDPNVVSSAQTTSNKDTAAFNAALNHGNTYTPLGSQTNTLRGYDEKTGAPIYDETTTLSPESQALLDQQLQQNKQLGDIAGGMMGRVGESYGKPMDTSGAPALRDPGQAALYQTAINRSGLPAIQGSLDTSKLSKLYGADDLQSARQQTQDALYKKQASFLDPQWAQRDNAFRTRMANQGVVEGSEAWKNGLDDENRARSFDYDQARNSAIAGGGDELSRLVSIAQGNRGQQFGEELSSGQFGNQARAQAFGEGTDDANFANSAIGANNADRLNYADAGNRSRAQALQELFAMRDQPLNEFNSLRNSAPVDMPNFDGAGGGGGMAPTDVAGNIWNAYQGQVAGANADQAGANARYASNGALAGSAAMAAALFF
jgi:hypothetical protein